MTFSPGIQAERRRFVCSLSMLCLVGLLGAPACTRAPPAPWRPATAQSWQQLRQELDRAAARAAPATVVGGAPHHDARPDERSRD